MYAYKQIGTAVAMTPRVLALPRSEEMTRGRRADSDGPADSDSGSAGGPAAGDDRDLDRAQARFSSSDSVQMSGPSFAGAQARWHSAAL